LALGRTVQELTESMTTEELNQWAEFYSLEPWGDWPRNLRTAHIVSVLANVNRDPKKRDQPYSLEECMLFKPPVVKTEEGGVDVAPETIAFLFAKAGNGN
jgi:hypothetical protein